MDEYQIPLEFNNELAYLCCHPPTPHELETLPQIIMTADGDWTPIMEPLIGIGRKDVEPLPSTTPAVILTIFMLLTSLITTPAMADDLLAFWYIRIEHDVNYQSQPIFQLATSIVRLGSWSQIL
jgi:hypothetical protein